MFHPPGLIPNAIGLANAVTAVSAELDSVLILESEIIKEISPGKAVKNMAGAVSAYFSKPAGGMSFLRHASEIIESELRVVSGISGGPPNIGLYKRITQQEFDQAFDPGSPTVAVPILESLPGTALAALAASQLRAAGEKTANIIFFMPFPGACRVVKCDDSNLLIIQKGAVVDKTGAVCYGDLPQPVSADSILACGATQELLFSVGKSCERLGIPLATPLATMETCRDKSLSKYAVQNMPIRQPPSIMIGEDEREDLMLVQLKVDLFLKNIGQPCEVVLKPTCMSQGTGVRFVRVEDNPESFHELVGQVLGLTDLYGPVMIEKRIPSYPRYEKEQRLDWNLRVIVTEHGVIDIEVRTHKWGTPVNKALGAKIEEFTLGMFEQSGSPAPFRDEKDFQEFRRKIEADSVEIAKALGPGIFGLDVIIEPDLERSCIEINSGAVGGISSLAQIRPDYEAKMSAALGLLEYFNHTEVRSGPITKLTRIDPFRKPSVSDLMYLARELTEFSPIDDEIDDRLKVVGDFLASQFLRDLSPRLVPAFCSLVRASGLLERKEDVLQLRQNLQGAHPRIDHAILEALVFTGQVDEAGQHLLTMLHQREAKAELSQAIKDLKARLELSLTEPSKPSVASIAAAIWDSAQYLLKRGQRQQTARQFLKQPGDELDPEWQDSRWGAAIQCKKYGLAIEAAQKEAELTSHRTDIASTIANQRARLNLASALIGDFQLDEAGEIIDGLAGERLRQSDCIRLRQLAIARTVSEFSIWGAALRAARSLQLAVQNVSKEG